LGGFDSQLCYKPWWIAQHLAAPASYSKTSASHGLDNYFVDHAMRTGKGIGGLESVDEHIAVMGGLSDRDGEFMLQDALTQPDSARVSRAGVGVPPKQSFLKTLAYGQWPASG